MGIIAVIINLGVFVDVAIIVVATFLPDGPAEGGVGTIVLKSFGEGDGVVATSGAETVEGGSTGVVGSTDGLEEEIIGSIGQKAGEFDIGIGCESPVAQGGTAGTQLIEPSAGRLVAGPLEGGTVSGDIESVDKRRTRTGGTSHILTKDTRGDGGASGVSVEGGTDGVGNGETALRVVETRAPGETDRALTDMEGCN